MAVVTVKLVKEDFLGDFYFKKDLAAFARKLDSEGNYRVCGIIDIPGLEGEDAAEEMFDLTNNPSREDEREEMYGNYRSVSVGDIVNVDGSDWLCCSQGWWKI